MKAIFLADLKESTEKSVLEHLANNYSGKESGFDYGDIKDTDITEAKNKLKGMRVLVAYESVGSWGYQSSSWFLLKNKNELFEVHGSHCSCYGFEGQLSLEPTTIEALKDRANKGSVFYAGGYDDDETENQKIVNEYILSL